MNYISLPHFFRSMRHAFRGVRRALAMENSFRIHIAVALAVIFGLLVFRLPMIETAILVLLIASILALELMNTVVERFVDILEPRVHPYAGMIKDLMSAAVLIMSVAAIIIGAMIVGSHLRS